MDHAVSNYLGLQFPQLHFPLFSSPPACVPIFIIGRREIDVHYNNDFRQTTGVIILLPVKTKIICVLRDIFI